MLLNDNRVVSVIIVLRKIIELNHDGKFLTFLNLSLDSVGIASFVWHEIVSISVLPLKFVYFF